MSGKLRLTDREPEIVLHQTNHDATTTFAVQKNAFFKFPDAGIRSRNHQRTVHSSACS